MSDKGIRYSPEFKKRISEEWLKDKTKMVQQEIEKVTKELVKAGGFK